MRLSLTTANRAAIAVLAGLLAGCSNTSPGSQPLPLGSSGATNRSCVSVLPATSVQFAYVTNFGSDNVSAYSIDAASGGLTALPGSPFKAGLPRGSVD